MRTLTIVLGDQLDHASSAFDGFDSKQDAVWMAEVVEESQHVPSAKQRIAMFLSAMRHFALEMGELGRPVHYTKLEDPRNRGTLAAEFAAAIETLRPQRLVLTEPGDWRVLGALRAVAVRAKLALEVRPDRHFFASIDDFKAHARGRKSLRLEYFYREMRRRHGVLMQDGEPCGGRWNFDADNRGTFGSAGPGQVPARASFEPDATTRAVIELVGGRFADHPGSLEGFAWPVTRRDAERALVRFIEERLPDFGAYQDAMWTGEPWLYHAHIAASLNLKLLSPREAVAAAEAAFRGGRAPLAAVEGFVRQILGWREYVRGIYWTRMPEYLESNALQADEPLPAWYWSGATDFACLREVIGQTLATGYAHHIQRLMVTGLFALLLGVRPREIHAWYLAVYVDAVEWVELPNVLGMSQYADGGVVGSKPYVASGKYIERMSNYCSACRYDPALREGERACPFTTLYWDFLLRHAKLLAKNPRMALQVRNVARLTRTERESIMRRAGSIRQQQRNTIEHND